MLGIQGLGRGNQNSPPYIENEWPKTYLLTLLFVSLYCGLSKLLMIKLYSENVLQPYKQNRSFN